MKAEISSLDKMRTRPRFKIYTSLSPELYEKNLRHFLTKAPGKFTGNINKEVATISVKTEEDFYYKPYLALRTELEDNRTVVRGVFGPSSEIWTFFVFIYSILTIIWMVLITLWFVGDQIKVEDYTWCLPLSFLMLFLMLLTYFAARYGQHKGKKEMALLRRFAIESTLKFED